MVKDHEIQKVKQAAHKFFQKMNLEGKIEVRSPHQETIPIKLEVDKPQLLIGKEGRTLAQIQHLLKSILRNEIDSQFYIDLDINNYKQKKIPYLKQLARDTGDEVALAKQEKQLPAMPPYERRIIHLELADRRDVTTQSVGQEPRRRVVVKPYP